MKLPSLLFVASLITSVSAFSDPGAYERLWYWYAYTMDTSRSKIAPGCSRSVSSRSPCTFAQFMKYIDLDPNADLLEDKIKNVDTTDVQRAFQALVDGHYTGAYNCGKIHVNVKGANSVSKLMEAITGFIEGKISTASDQLKLNLQQVTLGVAKGRQEAAIPGLTESLQKYGITLKTRQIPTFTGSTDECTFIDFPATAKASGKSGEDVTNAIVEIQEKDPGHSGNIRMARRGAASVANACLG